MAQFMCRKCGEECFDPIEINNGIHNGCAEEQERRAREAECLDAHRERSIADLMVAARDAMHFIEQTSRPRMGITEEMLGFAREYVVRRLSETLEDLDQYNETDDPRANGWVGQDGLP